MKESSGLRKISDLALRHRRQGLVKLLPPAEEILRGSLIERYVTCGNPNCKCARGERHGPVWYLTVTLGPGRTTGGIIAREKLSSAALDRKLPSLQRTTGKNLGNQPRTTATGAGAEAGKIMKPLPRGKGLDVAILHL